MSAPPAIRALRYTARISARSLSRATQTRSAQSPALRCAVTHTRSTQQRWLSISTPVYAGLMPDAEEPKPPVNETPQDSAQPPAQLTDDEYHAVADEYMNTVHEKAEQLQENREDVEVDYSAGVLSITFPPNGTYIINKQPPNKQIWLSSPLSGPKRYDWVVAGEGMNQKEGGGTGEWVYLRDGTKLTTLLNKELGLIVTPEEELKQSVDPTE